MNTLLHDLQSILENKCQTRDNKISNAEILERIQIGSIWSTILPIYKIILTFSINIYFYIVLLKTFSIHISFHSLTEKTQ